MNHFIKVEYKDIKELINSSLNDYFSPFDSFLEEHILNSEHFLIKENTETIGFFSIHNKDLLTQFYVLKIYRHLSQTLFYQIKKMFYVQYAFVPTSNEFYLSHALDEYKRIDHQAYFFQDSNREIPNDKFIPHFNLTLAKLEDIEEIKHHSGDFFDHLEEQIKNKEIYQGRVNDEIVGYGIIEKCVIRPEYISIGMFVLENKRLNGIGRNILLHLKKEVYHMNKIPIAGCWYYNHFSKKTLESAGMFSQTRLLKIYY